MKDSGLTESKMANKKFRTTEVAILLAYYKFRDFPTAKVLARRAHISRSTLYRHHPSLRSIPKDYENYLLRAYTYRIRALLRKNPPLKALIFRTLVFIHNHRLIFTALFKDNHKEIIKKMFNKLKPCILKEWGYAGDAGRLYKIYQNEVLGVIETWSEHNFSTKELERVLGDILYLTDTTPKRLSRFLGASE